MLASSLVFAVAALVVAGVLLAPRLGQAGGVGQAGPVRQVGQAAPSDSTSASPPSASTAPGTATYPATFVAVVDGGLELVTRPRERWCARSPPLRRAMMRGTTLRR